MLGYFSLSNEPADGDAITFDINGNNIVLTAKTTLGSTAGQVKIGGSAAAFVANCVALLQQPQTTTSTGVALSTADQQLLSYLTFAVPGSGTTLYAMNNNTKLYAPLSSFTGSTTTSGNSWTAQTMQLYIHSGTVYVNGTRVLWTGGSTPTVTGPVSNPRIDVLTINSSGALAWTTGTEASSPSAPTYPADKVALIELYNVVSETGLYDNENQQSGQGYVYNDVRPIIGQILNPSAIPDSLIPSSANSLDLGSASFPWRNIYGNGANITGLNTSRAVQSFTAGGTINASTTPQAVYVKSADGKVYVADVGADESAYKFIGFVGDGQNVSANASVNVTIGGYLAGFSSLTQDGYYYLNSSGAISTTPDTTRPLRVGFAVSTTAIIVVFGQRIRYVTDSYSGTAGATHTITCGFRPRLVVGLVNGTNSTTAISQFQANELSSVSSQIEGNAPKIYTGQIGEMYDTSAVAYRLVTLGSFTDTGFSATYSASTGSCTASVEFIIYGE